MLQVSSIDGYFHIALCAKFCCSFWNNWLGINLSICICWYCFARWRRAGLSIMEVSGSRLDYARNFLFVDIGVTPVSIAIVFVNILQRAGPWAKLKLDMKRQKLSTTPLGPEVENKRWRESATRDHIEDSNPWMTQMSHKMRYGRVYEPPFGRVQ